MNLRFLIFFFTVFLIAGTAYALPLAADSTKVVMHNGKQHVQHKVKPKETLFSVSRKYGVHVNQIRDANPGMNESLKIGETILVPLPAKARNATVATEKPAKPTLKPTAVSRVFTTDDNGVKWHTVAAGQTMFSVANLYSISLEELKKMNNLPDNQINIGQKLKVGKQAPGTPNKLAQYVPEKDDDLEASVKPVPASNAKPLLVSAAPATEISDAAVTAEREEAEPAKAAEPTKRIAESGLAAVINTPFQSAKFLALHKTAPVGTMLQVKNSMNGKTVFVRVIGQLPDTGENDKVVVKISRKAYQSLGALDNRFYAEISYLQ